MCMHHQAICITMSRTLGSHRGQIPKLKVFLPTPKENCYSVENQGIKPEKGGNIKKIITCFGIQH